MNWAYASCVGRLTPYATKPPKTPPQPLKEYQASMRKGTSDCVHQIEVRIVMPGVTTASTNPRKNLQVSGVVRRMSYVFQKSWEKWRAPVDHRPCEARTCGRPVTTLG